MNQSSFFQNLRFGFSFHRVVIFAFTVAILALSGCKKESDIVPIDDDDCPPELVQFDYDGDRMAIEAFYRQNLYAYWANYGFPALSNLAQMRANLGETGVQTAFDGAGTAFSPEMFFNALESGQLPPPVVQDYYALPASNPWFAVLKSIRRYGEQIYNAAAEGNPASAHLARDELQRLTMLCFDPEKLLALSVVGGKVFEEPSSAMVNVRVCCGKNHLAGLLLEAPAPRPIDTTRIKWTDIVFPFQTEHNRNCATLATGACAHKLGLLKEDVDSSGWSDLSKGIAPPAGHGGVSGIKAWFEGKGYGMSTARYGVIDAADGVTETASQEAKRALDDGCDVMIWYKNGDRAGHIEVVTAIEVDPNDAEKSTVSTLSWGRSATVTFRDGKFSNKSDGRRYRRAGEVRSWLERESDAELIYFCKK